MKTHPYLRRFLVVFGASLVALLSSAARAATVTNNNALWPTGAAFQTLDVNTVTNSANADFGGQTFQVSSGFTVGKIYLQISGYSGSAGTLEFYEVPDIGVANFGTSWSNLSPAIATISIGTGASHSGASNVEITLAANEQFTLATRNTGTQGYLMKITSTWTGQHSNTGSDLYSGGFMYRESGVQNTTTRDWGMALVAVPEPTTFFLSSFGLLLLLRRRR